ncbi:hypothetical protein K8I28_15640 [bacterium]|nr:hypothetical protein [bacterium]
MNFQLSLNSLTLQVILLSLVTRISAILAITLPVTLSAVELSFQSLTIRDGLSQNSVTCIHQDSAGFMWFGTQDGLTRYDGYEFAVYRPEVGNPYSLTDNWINSIEEDEEGILWLGTYEGGVNRFDRHTKRFSAYRNVFSDNKIIPMDQIRTLHLDDQGVVWVVSWGGELLKRTVDGDSVYFISYHFEDEDNENRKLNIQSMFHPNESKLLLGIQNYGLLQFDTETEEVLHFPHPDDATVTAIIPLSDDLYLLGTERHGLYHLERSSKKYTAYPIEKTFGLHANSLVVRTLFRDNKHRIWIGTALNGAFMATADDSLYHLTSNPDDANSLSHDVINTFFEDRAGNIWIGTDGGGVCLVDEKRSLFKSYLTNIHTRGSESFSDIWAISEDRNGELWIGTNLLGLVHFNKTRSSYHFHTHEPDDPKSIGSNRIRCILSDSRGRLWVGTRGGGLHLYDPDHDQFLNFKNIPDDANSLSNNWVRALMEDDQGNIWIGTGGSGVDVFDPRKNEFRHFQNDTENPTSLSHDNVTALYQDREGTIWIATRGQGFNKYNPESETFTQYCQNLDHENTLSHNTVLSFLEDSEGNFWIGTAQGLNKFDRKTEKFSHYFATQDGLPNSVIYGILEDDNGYIWLSTNEGLSRFDYSQSFFRNFSVEDGLQSNEFTQGAYYKSPSGEIYFGGINGVNSFFSDSIDINQYVPPVVITSFKVFDEELVNGRDISFTREIELDHSRNFFSLEFAALNYLHPEKNWYKYYLEGLDNSWISAGTRRFVSYTNLDPGKYTFHVQGSNNDNIWNEAGVSLKINIPPPIWATWWFRIAVLLTVLAYVVSRIRYHARRITQSRLKLESKVEERTRELKEALVKLEESRKAEIEADRLRTVRKLSATIAHEFNNPLTIMVGVVHLVRESLGNNIDPDLKRQIEKLPRAVERMNALVAQLLKITKVEEADYAAGVKFIDIHASSSVDKELPEDSEVKGEADNGGST